MRIFLDTNIFLRYFTKDNQKMYDAVEIIFQLNDQSQVHLATSTIVLTEVMFTLRSLYRLNKKIISQHVESILEIKNLLLIDQTNFQQAYRLHKKSGEKIADCLIVTQVPSRYALCSFDQGLSKIIGEKRFVTPEKVVSLRR